MSRAIESAAINDVVDDNNNVSCTKRQKISDSSSVPFLFIDSSKADGSVDVPKEWVLHIPPRLTKSAYQVLLACHVAPRQWHLEGRFGSRTHVVEKSITNGIPILYNEEQMKKNASGNTDLKELLDTDGVSVVEKLFVRNHRTKQLVPEIDARIHPELEPNAYKIPMIKPTCMTAQQNQTECSFTYAEMFGGIGGFGVGLEALGGKCLFYSEIDEQCRETYKLNFPSTDHSCIHGDIYEVPNSAFPQNIDLLVAGFPCQPFSNLGEQLGLSCEKGRGQLFLQIVRALEVSRPKAFLLENVPGLLGMKETLDIILKAFCSAGYKVNAEVCSARGLTATGRKRLFFVGIHTTLAESESETQNSTKESSLDTFYRFPYIPDLKLCSHDILDYDTLNLSEKEILTLSQATFDQLIQNSRWKPHQLAWPNKQCDTLTSHYGNSVGRGDCQLVPSPSPYPPRRFSVRECARIMGFPNSFKFADARQDQGEMAYRKQCYRMLGNAVCPPLITALAGSVLDAAGLKISGGSLQTNDWTEQGREVAIMLACAALRPGGRLPLPAGCLFSSEWEEASLR